MCDGIGERTALGAIEPSGNTCRRGGPPCRAAIMDKLMSALAARQQRMIVMFARKLIMSGEEKGRRVL